MKRTCAPANAALRLIVTLAAAGLLVACSDEPYAAPSPKVVPPVATVQAAPTTPPSPAVIQPAAAPSEAASDGVTVSVKQATVARYLVREELQRLDLPVDAVGETSDVRGAIMFRPDGSVDSGSSNLQVGLSGLRSDEDRRDRWVRSQLFNTSQFPDAELTVTSVEGLSWPLPESGEVSFQLVSDLTIKGVTSPTRWDVAAQFSSGAVTGRASTVVTFEQFGLPKPRFAFILSVADEIRLEIDIDASIN